MNVKRPEHSFVRFADVEHISINDLLKGEITVTTHPESLASTPTVRGEVSVSGDELRLLSKVPSGRWVSADALARELGIGVDVADGLVEKGLLLTDGEDAAAVTAREREATYAATFWNPHAAFHHFNAKWRDRTGNLAQQAADIAAFSEPEPDPYYEYSAPRRRQSLSPVSEDRVLHQLLRKRRTKRAWDANRPLPLSELSAVLGHVYGSQGEAPPSLYQAIKKTSPSGGGLHPVEVFPIVRNVEGLAPGLYHYNVRSHALDLLREMPREELAAVELTFLAGQNYFVGAAVLFVMVVRFYRHNWKYRRHFKALKVVHMDAGHLSQTFYLVCAERGLGAFFTGAVNEENIEAALGLDPLQFGVVGINGCGYAAEFDPMSL